MVDFLLRIYIYSLGRLFYTFDRCNPLHLFINRFAHKGTSSPNILPLQYKHSRCETQYKCYETQQTASPLKTEVRIYGHRRQWQKGSKDILTKAHSGTRTACVLRVSVRDVHHDGLHDDHSTKADESESDGRQDPGEESVACPSVPEDPAGEANKAARDAEVETDFGKAGIGLSRMCYGGARVYSVLDEAGDESRELSDDD